MLISPLAPLQIVVVCGLLSAMAVIARCRRLALVAVAGGVAMCGVAAYLDPPSLLPAASAGLRFSDASAAAAIAVLVASLGMLAVLVVAEIAAASIWAVRDVRRLRR